MIRSRFRPAAPLIAVACALALPGSVFAQSFVPLSTEEGYAVERSHSDVNAPPGTVGRKTSDRERRVGNTEETDGNETTVVLTFGGFARKCPTAEGIVAGSFEYALSYDEINTDDGQAQHNHLRRHLLATLEGHVRDDATLDYVKLDGEYTAESSGTRFEAMQERRPVRITFTPGPAGEPDWPAATSAVQMAGDVAVAAVILWAGEFYKSAEVAWRERNACVEFSFDPPTETRALGPSESVQVRMELKTNGDAPSGVGGAKPAIRVLNGAGSVSPTSVEIRADAPVTLTYTASSQPRRGHGIEVTTLSRAGHAEAQWLISEGPIKLTIEHRIWDDRGTPRARGGFALFDGAVKFDITLARLFPQIPGRFDGTATVVRPMQVSHITPKCRGSASQTEEWRVIANVDAAAKSLLLDANMFTLDEVGEWTCVPGGRDELLVDVHEELGLIDVPAVIGTPQTFQIARHDGKHETLTVTVLAAPEAR